MATRASDRGQASVSIDGGTPVVVDLYSASFQGRRIVFAANGLSASSHTLVITVHGIRSAWWDVYGRWYRR